MNRQLDLYFAGDYSFPYEGKTTDLHLLGYNRLLSYDYQRKLVDKLIERKKMLQLYLAGADKFGTEERKKYMDLYLAGAEGEPQSTAEQISQSNFLFSYANKQTRSIDFDFYKANNAKLFIDSGAFSMFTRGITIDVDEYINWLNERSDYLDLYGQVDTIPDYNNPTPENMREAGQKTWDNYLYMRERLKKPEGLLYTYHNGEPIEFLKQALEWTDENGNHIPYIALGGMAILKTHYQRDVFLDRCFEIIKNSSNPNVKVHAFGMTDASLAEKYPITSADSTSWIMVGATGGVLTDVGTVTVSSKQVSLPTHYSHLPKEAVDSFNKTIEEFGFTLDELAEDRNKRLIHNARFMRKRFSMVEYKPQQRKKRLF